MSRMIIGFEDGRAVCILNDTEQAIAWVGDYKFRTWSAMERVGHETATLRDQFAMATLTGFLANNSDAPYYDDTRRKLVGICYNIADHMLEERRK